MRIFRSLGALEPPLTGAQVSTHISIGYICRCVGLVPANDSYLILALDSFLTFLPGCTQMMRAAWSR